MSLPNLDDKDLAILSIALIALTSVIVLSDPTTVVASSISAIAGIAVGRKLSSGTNGSSHSE
jgi:hypothetical protein